MGELRRVVRAQLGAWGLGNLADLAELALSELATNVVRHVGDGTPAACTLEAHHDRVRLTMHDVSATLPAQRQATVLDENGRGLDLVAAVSNAWGASPGPAGKSIWCELADWTSPEDRMLRRRIQRASRVVESYRREYNSDRHLLAHVPTAEETTTALISDLLRWLDAQGGDPREVVEQACIHHFGRFEKGW
ncbi:hypothetical protein SCATT_33810 [Streptantibioticus cattleyicolor NRRL 8057 = DSM 46488]|uniref:Histidine kinase/HSP90-like ATPase domain-containing protein n=1 Tax=Streptantibioticus cattleyicolor (strain ATCC 35852 / DSM 46488 / JCM 4925 / NBRC 14057 / NRRL 8057) TaxID=1003195 RepID=F8JWH2_STREN|nr:hypothetical protein SCATT_33810 [Streptantibioticus cattleyicolor NRRL 8057 = DSM 46488]MYS60297.1 hypothetical protein [Streptomyces sp. SID5468]CCB76092.1 putative regulatory protein [Streptantibioticus cattleyicolor NRRL 8057 = DSM 46488]